jgi:uncharacterized lipoprotein
MMNKLSVALALFAVILLAGCSGENGLLLLKSPETQDSADAQTLTIPANSADAEAPPQLPEEEDIEDLPALPDDSPFSGSPSSLFG